MTKDSLEYNIPNNFSVMNGKAYHNMNDIIKETPSKYILRKNAEKTSQSDSCIIFKNENKQNIIHMVQSKRYLSVSGNVSQIDEVMKSLFSYIFEPTKNVIDYPIKSNEPSITIRFTPNKISKLFRLNDPNNDSLKLINTNTNNTDFFKKAGEITTNKIIFDLVGDFTQVEEIPDSFKGYLSKISLNVYGRDQNEFVYGKWLSLVRELRSYWNRSITEQSMEIEGDIYSDSEDDELFSEENKYQNNMWIVFFLIFILSCVIIVSSLIIL